MEVVAMGIDKDLEVIKATAELMILAILKLENGKNLDGEEIETLKKGGMCTILAISSIKNEYDNK